MANDNLLHHLKLVEKESVGKDCHKLMFEGDIGMIPGQFMMLWLPRTEEVPMSISHSWNGRIGFTIKNTGEATGALCSMKIGESMRARGPFGRGFQPKGKRWLVVAGGVGAAPLLPLVGMFGSSKKTIVLGAKTKSELVLEGDLRQSGAEMMVSTDDGSSGFKGTASDLCRKLLDEKNAFDSIYCCGPEQMISSVMQSAREHGIWGQAALERHMKCGIGICGSCAINDKLVCRDGPVFTFSDLSVLTEFGKIKREASGRARRI